jgi:hypothetical protein
MSDDTNAGAPVEAPRPLNSEGDIDLRIAAAVEARMAGIASAYDRKIKAIEKRYEESLKSARGIRKVDHQVPTNAGGPANEIHQTWSQYHQELANAGLLTDAHLAITNGLTPPEADEDEDVMANA